MNRVFVLSNTKEPLMPCKPERAKQLLSNGKAVVYRYYPFTIILKDRAVGDTQPIEFKIDPGSHTTGLVLVGNFPKQGRIVLFAANLWHRGQQIVASLLKRRQIRRSRRNRKTRYRAPRFLNRVRLSDWWQPSLKSRVDNIINWFNKFLMRTPITECHVESVKFDTQKLDNPNIFGIEYQHGTLFGFEIKEYLLEKHERTCVYCGAKSYGEKSIRLEVEHIIPKSRGGTNRIDNLTLACYDCNRKKDNLTAEEFGFPNIQNKVSKSFKDAAAVNITRKFLLESLKKIGIPVFSWAGSLTKFNRVQQKFSKDHWVDAACVGENGNNINLNNVIPLTIKAKGRGSHRVVRPDKFGFPNSTAGRCKRVFNFSTGDFVKLVQPRGKYQGVHFGRLAGVGKKGQLNLNTKTDKISAPYDRFKLLFRGDGYVYS